MKRQSNIKFRTLKKLPYMYGKEINDLWHEEEAKRIVAEGVERQRVYDKNMRRVEDALENMRSIRRIFG